jgi:hypothetical protein
MPRGVPAYVSAHARTLNPPKPQTAIVIVVNVIDVVIAVNVVINVIIDVVIVVYFLIKVLAISDTSEHISHKKGLPKKEGGPPKNFPPVLI